MKQKRDLEMSENPQRDSLKPYLSHRLSGQISQFPDFSAFNYELNLESLDEDVHEEQGSFINNRTSDSRQKAVVIEDVDGETVPDVIGVLITGMRLILGQHEGDVEMVFFN
jgi:hypothetical protein